MHLQDVRLALIFKDFAAWLRTSCVGLHVAGYATAEVLRRHGVHTTVFPVRHNVDIVDSIELYNRSHEKPLTHVVISAPWLSVWDLEAILNHFNSIQFVILSHSNVGFLQADAKGVHLLREYHVLARKYHNLKVGGNSAKFVEWMRAAYGNDDFVLLPNLYPITEDVQPKTWHRTSPLKIGAFGAVRPQKNFMTAAAAALSISRELRVSVELHMSFGGEGDGQLTAPAIDQMLRGTQVTIVRHNWAYWDDFIKLVEQMDLMIQVSYTESFNMVTADGISVGIPSVVSPVIYWAPERWRADPDDAQDVANKGIYLLTRRSHLGDGIRALKDHNNSSWHFWENFLLPKYQGPNWHHTIVEGIKYVFRRGTWRRR